MKTMKTIKEILRAISPMVLFSVATFGLVGCMTDSERKDLENRLDETIQDLERTQSELDRTLSDWENDLDETIADYDSWSACMEIWDYAPPAGACD